MALVRQPAVCVVEEGFRTDRGCCPRGEKQYRIRDGGAMNDLFLAKEEMACCCQKCCCLWKRGFEVHLKDMKDKPIMLEHGCMICTCLHCCSCCRHEMNALRDGKLIGYMSSECYCCCNFYPSFFIHDKNGKKNFYSFQKFKFCAACFGGCSCCCCSISIPRGYSIKSYDAKDGSGGSIEELPRGVRKESSFKLTFPDKASEDHRVLLLGITFLIDYQEDDTGRANEPESIKMSDR